MDRRAVFLRPEGGVLLPEALAALVLVGLVALAASGLVAAALWGERDAASLAAARGAAGSALARVAACSWARLPSLFGSSPGDSRFLADSRGDPTPEVVAGLVDGLPAGRLVIVVEPLGPGGNRVPFREAVACRVRARVTWWRGDRRRRVEAVDVRY